jgi:hypothetical protein
MKLRWKKPIKIKPLLNERGSSSVLVIMIMLLLITFGVLAMMSSYSNLKIARKHAEWTRDYYQLESIADSDLKSFEQLFDKAIVDTQVHFVNDAFELSTLIDLPVGIKATLMEDVDSVTLPDQLFLYHLYDAYMTAPLFDKHYSSNFSYAVTSEALESGWLPEITYVTKDEATNRQLLVKIAIDLSKDDVISNSMKIVEWREIPAEFEYDETLDYKDPEGN